MSVESIDGGVLPLEPAERVWVGKYELLSRLGAGGMAEVFLARTIAIAGIEKLAALKRIRPDFARDARMIELLLHEARVAASLHHPNVVQIHDAGEDDESVFFTMEYVAGKDLRQVVQAAQRQRQRLPLGHVLHVVIGCAAGLHYAHEHVAPDGTPLAIVHRDVSPSNILVSYDGAVKIVDFGIARAAAGPDGEQPGALRGKVPYMSPEQCRGEALDRRSDVFSLGVILWELSVGRRLFTHLKGQDHELAAHIAGTPATRPSAVHPDYPPALERIVMKALELDPARRTQSALELQLELEEFARERRLVTSQARLGETMRQLFADEIRGEEEAVKGYLSLHQATPPPAAAGPSTRPPTRAHPGVASPVQALFAEAERPAWRRHAPVAVALVALAVAAAVILQSGAEPAPAAPKAPPPASSGRAWEDDSPILNNTPTPAPRPAPSSPSAARRRSPPPRPRRRRWTPRPRPTSIAPSSATPPATTRPRSRRSSAAT